MDNLREAFFSWIETKRETVNDLTLDTDAEEIRKALIETDRFPKYYAVRENIIIDLGFNIDGQDVERGEHDLVGRYGLFIVRRHSDGRPSFDFELLDDGTSTSEAQDQAVTLVENAKNNVVNVRVGIGVAWTFASRPIFKGTIAFFRVARGVEGFAEEDELDELEKAGTVAQSILFPKDNFSISEARTWLESHGKKFGKSDSPANFHRFRQFDPSRCASAIKTISFGKSGIKATVCVQKDVVSQDVHVDTNVQSPGKKKKKRTGDTVKYDDWDIEKGAKLGAFLRSKRDALGLSNATLASAAGISESTVKQILNGSIDRPPDSRLRGMARALKVSFSTLQSLAGGSVEKLLNFEVEIHKADIDRGLIYGVVYEPFRKDSHGDHTSPEEIENAAHNFLPSSVMNIDHKDNNPEVEVVESFIAPCDFTYSQNGGGESLDKEKVLRGAWVLVTKVHDKALLESIRNGERTAYSLEGTAQKL